jgi:dihydroneopterin aldolase
MATSRDVITLKSMRFHALVGVYPHEREFAQPIEIDLAVELIPDGAFVDYAQLYAGAAKIMGQGHIEYIETIAERVAQMALDVDGVHSATVAVRKPHVALGGALDYAELRITRNRV